MDDEPFLFAWDAVVVYFRVSIMRLYALQLDERQ
jgi:hypothetical protein